jgi:hypothetical protein
MISPWEWLVRGATAAFLGVALWYTAGPWSVQVDGSSYGCGSPLMGRYRSIGDPAASASWACHLQAANRLHIAAAAWAIVLIFASWSLVLGLRRLRRHAS